MKKILAVLFLLASACSAQVETGGLRIPGDGAIQIAKKSAAVEIPEWPTDSIYADFVYTEYTNSIGGTLSWTDQSGNGRNATQTTETAKPVASDTGFYFDGAETQKRVVFPRTSDGDQTLVFVGIISAGLTGRGVFGGYDSGTDSYFYGYPNNASGPVWYHPSGGGDRQMFSPAGESRTDTAGKKFCLVYAVNNSNPGGYVEFTMRSENGVEKQGKTGLNANGVNFAAIGAYNYSGTWYEGWKGYCQRVRVYSRTLSATEALNVVRYAIP